MSRTALLSLTCGLAFSTAVYAAAGGGAAGAFRGQVVDAAGHPVKFALVSARSKTNDITTVAITDDRGGFVVPHLNDGKYEIVVSKEGYEPDVENQQLPAAKSLRATIKELSLIPVDQLRDEEIIKYMPDDNPQKTARGGGGGANVALADQSDKTLVRDRCVRCHTLAKVFDHGRTKQEWDEVVTRMGTHPVGASNPVGYNLAAGPAIKERIVNYLTKYIGPDETTTAMIQKKATAAKAPEIPLGSGVVYTEWEIPTPTAMPHTGYPDKHGHVWITEYGVAKMGRLDLASGKIDEFPVVTPGGTPHGLTVGEDGVAWFTIPGGNLGRTDPNGKVEEFVPPKGQPAGQAVIVARDGMVWYTTPGGLGSFDPQTRKFGAVIADSTLAAPYALIQSKVDPDVMWLCVEGQNRAGWLNVKTGESNLLHTTLAGPKRPRIDSRGRVFFGYYEGGAVGMIDPATMKLKDFVLPYRGTAYAIHVDDKDQVWVASYERGSLIKLDPDTGKMVEYPWPSPGGIVRDIWPDEQGNLWFAFFAWTHNTVVRAERPKGEGTPVKTASAIVR